MKLVKEMIEFDFSKLPMDRYKKSPSTKGRFQDKNPRKKGGMNLLPQEEEIIDRHKNKISKLEEEIEDINFTIDDIKEEISDLKGSLKGHYDDEAKEEMAADIIDKYGYEVLDILSSGLSDDEKIDRIRFHLPLRRDEGYDPEMELIEIYSFYYPDEEYIEEINNQISKLNKKIDGKLSLISQKEIQIESLQTKIYNLENY